MNGRLIVSLFGGMLFGLSAGAYAVVSGWGLLAGIGLYSGVGSVSVLVLALVLRDRGPRPAPRSGWRPSSGVRPSLSLRARNG